MNERLENYLLDQIDRLTADLSKEKENGQFWYTAWLNRDETIKKQGAVIGSLADQMAKKDEEIKQLKAELINQREKCDKMENTICDLQAELLEAQSRAN
jgi:hypothetical protein